jgi:phosphoglycolate phosphatase-like HAD superfamily hydrolase
MFEGFIPDVEGTLVDSISQNLRSLQDALEKFGHRITMQTLRRYSGLAAIKRYNWWHRMRRSPSAWPSWTIVPMTASGQTEKSGRATGKSAPR